MIKEYDDEVYLNGIVLLTLSEIGRKSREGQLRVFRDQWAKFIFVKFLPWVLVYVLSLSKHYLAEETSTVDRMLLPGSRVHNIDLRQQETLLIRAFFVLEIVFSTCFFALSKIFNDDTAILPFLVFNFLNQHQASLPSISYKQCFGKKLFRRRDFADLQI